MMGLPTYEEQEQERAFRTFRNYLRAWVLAIEDEVGEISDETAYLSTLASLPKIQAVQRKKIGYLELQSDYVRGALNLKAMQAVPLSDYPQLAPSLAMWLPVQAYYSIHGLGLATLVALGSPAPQTHKKFRRMMSESVILARIPGVLGARATWSGQKDMAFGPLRVDHGLVKAQSNLATPSGTNTKLLVAKSLATTRQQDHDLDLASARERLGRKRLNSDTREIVKGNLHPTSVVDFLWRLRVRANYGDPDMYLQPFRSEYEASGFCGDLVLLATHFGLALKSIIRQRIGREEFDKLEVPLPL